MHPTKLLRKSLELEVSESDLTKRQRMLLRQLFLSPQRIDWWLRQAHRILSLRYLIQKGKSCCVIGRRIGPIRSSFGHSPRQPPISPSKVLNMTWECAPGASVGGGPAGEDAERERLPPPADRDSQRWIVMPGAEPWWSECPPDLAGHARGDVEDSWDALLARFLPAVLRPSCSETRD